MKIKKTHFTHVIAVFISTLISFQVLAKEAQEESFSIILDSPPNTSHIALIAARELGFFSESDLDVNFVLSSSPKEAFQQIVDGRANLAITNQARLFLLIGEGAPVKRIATLIDTPLAGIISLSKSNIHTLQDLKGKHLGYAPESLESKIIRATLSQEETTANEIKFIQLEPPITQALLNGEIDAIITTDRQKIMKIIEISKKTATLLPIEELGVPSFDAAVVIAARNRLDDQKLKRFVQALERGTLWVLDHPQDAWKLIVQKYNFPNNDVEQSTYQDLLTRLSAQPQAFSSLRYKRFASFMAEHGLITVALPISNYAIELNDENKP